MYPDRQEQLAMLETAERLEMEGVGEFVEGSSLTIDELYARAMKNYYIHAEDALKDGLIAKILR